MIEQYPVDLYRIDIYIPEINLAIEYDEDRHKRQEKEDKERQEYIISVLKCTFMRIPEKYDIFDVIHKIFNIYRKKIKDSRNFLII